MFVLIKSVFFLQKFDCRKKAKGVASRSYENPGEKKFCPAALWKQQFLQGRTNTYQNQNLNKKTKKRKRQKHFFYKMQKCF